MRISQWCFNLCFLLSTMLAAGCSSDEAKVAQLTEELAEAEQQIADARDREASRKAAAEEAVARIERLGGTVERDEEDRVIGVELDGKNDLVVRALAKLPHVRRVLLDGNFDDKCLNSLALTPRVEQLHVKSGLFTDDGLKRLAEVSTLRSVHFEVGQFTDAGLAGLSELTELRSVTLPGTFGDAAMAHLQDLEKLTTIGLTLAPTEEFLSDFQPQPAWKRMTLRGSFTVDQLSAFRGLTSLQIAGTYSSEQVQQLKVALPDCAIWF